MDPSRHLVALQPTSLDVALDRARADFLEMPGLRLTAAQARRLWMLEPDLCSAVLAQLVATRFLTQTHNKCFARAGG